MKHDTHWPLQCLIAVVSFAVITGGLVACNGDLNPPAEIRIGVVAYQDSEIEGPSTINAAHMAIQEVNRDGGLEVGRRKHRVVLVEEWIDARPENAVSAVQKLVNQGNVVAIIGPQYSSDAIPAGEAAEVAGVPLISPISSNPQTTAGKEYVFRMGFVDDFQGQIMAHFARRDLGAQTAAVLFDIANPYSRDISAVFKETFEQDGGRVVAFESYTSDEQDFPSQLARIQDQQVDILVLPNFSDESLLQAQQARQMGITTRLLGADGWDRREFRELPEFEGCFMTANYSQDLDSERNRAFVEQYHRQFNMEPGDTAALTYDAFGILFQAIQSQGKADPLSIRDGLYALDPYEGVSGQIDFRENGDPIKSVVILQFKDGQDIFYKLVAPSE